MGSLGRPLSSTDAPVDALTTKPGRDQAGAPKTNLLTSGGALLTAKVIFVIAGYAIYVGLSRLLTSADYGTFLVVNSSVGVLNAVFVSGAIQTVSRFVSQTPRRAAGTLRTALWLHVALAGALVGGYFLAAPLIASTLNDPELVPYLRLSAVIPLAYAFYATMIGYLNGMRRFGQQAGFDMSFSVAKIAFVIGLPWLGFGTFGAVAGFSAASVLILLAAWIVIGRRALGDSTESPAPSSTIAWFEVAVMAHVGVTNLLMQLDLLMVKALSVGEDASVAAATYGSAAKLAQIPYSLLVAFNFLIFPYIARSTARAPSAETAQYIRQALRLGIALSVGPTIVLAVVSPQAVALVFGSRYASAAPVVELLVCGYVAFSLLTMVATIINGSGRPVISLAITSATVIAQAGLAWLLIPTNGIWGGAAASSGAYLIGLLTATIYLVTKFGPVLPWASFARIVVAALVVVAASRTPLGNIHVILAAPLLGAAYLLTLLVLREWDLADLRAAIGRAPRAA
jgi:O-antigen/teichoic acid export membrane protein